MDDRFFSPEILAELQEAYGRTEMPPEDEGWFMVKDLMEETGWSEKKARNVVADLVARGRLEERTNVHTSAHGIGNIYRFITPVDENDAIIG